MATTAHAMTINVPMAKRAAATVLFDWGFVLLSAFFLVGMFVDGWAHLHGQVDESFFTPWHAMFYAGFALIALLLFGKMFLNRRAGYSVMEAIPAGYEYALLGIFIFSGGGVGDMIWHTVFGIEADVEALFSPTHLVLFIGIALIASGPLRAAWLRTETTGGWGPLLPAVLSTTLLFSLITFTTQFAHPMVDPWAAASLAGEEMGGEIFTMRADGSGQTRLTRSVSAFDTQPAFSPDGSQVVFSSEADGDHELFLINADGSGPRQLTDNAAQDWQPAWSADGQQIAFTSEADGRSEIYVVDPSGETFTKLTSHEASDSEPAWSPDMKRITFVGERDGASDIFVMNIDGSEVVNLTNDPADDSRPTWSPDGKQIAFASERSSYSHLYLLSVETGEVRQITTGDTDNWHPAWSPSGGRLAFVSDRDGEEEIYAIGVDGTGLMNLTNNPALNDGFPAWSPDGGQVVYRSRGLDAGLSVYLSQAVGMASIILQSMLLIGVVLLLVRRWQLPFGALTLLFTLNAVAMTVLADEFRLIPAAVLAGLLADLLGRQLRLSHDSRNLRRFAFAVPFALYALYFATLFLTGIIEWTIHLWAGAIVIAGVAGGLMGSFVVLMKDAKT